MTRPARVAYVSLFSDFVGGGEHSLLELISHLPDAIQAELIIPSPGTLSFQAEKMGIPVHYLAMPKLGMASFPALRQWRGWLKRQSFDIVHANQSRAAFYAGFAAMGDKVKVIFHCRMADPDPRLDWLLVRLVDAVIANSHATAARFSQWPGLKVEVIHNGVGLPARVARRSRPFEAKLLLLCVARLSRWKRHDVVLEAFARVAKDFPGLHLACVGGDDPADPDWANQLRQIAEDSPFAKRIHWLGQQQNMTPCYQAADMLILASAREPFGRVLVEAMAWKLPVLACRGGGVPEIVEDGQQGYLVAPDDIEMMARRLSQLLSDAALRKRMGEKGRLRAKKFSIAAHVASVQDFYEGLFRYD